MTGPRIGGLFFGYGGLDMAVQDVYGGELAWVSEFDKGANKVIAHRYPGVPNHGDITKIKWAPDCPSCGGTTAVYRRRVEGDPYNEWAGEPFYWCPTCEREWDVSIRFADPDADRIPEPVDILTGGSPCQDLSHAGKRGGMTGSTRSNLWVSMREAIAQLRPTKVVWENVRGAFSAEADSDLEPCPRCVGDPRDGGPVLRALGRVLGDLSDLGYVGGWHGVPASRVGAPHGRFRVFVAADLADTEGRGEQDWAGRDDSRRPLVGPRSGAGRRDGAGDPASGVQQLGRGAGGDGAASAGSAAVPERGGRQRWRPLQLDQASVDAAGDGPGALLPTPAAYDGDRGGPQHPDKRAAGGHSVTLQDAVYGIDPPLLPTPRVGGMGDNESERRRHSPGLEVVVNQTVELLPTPRASDGVKGGPNQRGSSGDLMLPSAVGSLLPTPRATRGGSSTETAALLPTPTANDYKGSTAGRREEGADRSQLDAVLEGRAQRLLPTPVTSYSQRDPDDWRAGRPAGNGATRDAIGDLEVAVKDVEAQRLLPTPSGMNAANDPGSLESWEARRDRMLELGINGNGIGTPLGIAVQQLLPVVSDAKDAARHTTTTGASHPGTPLTDATRQEWGVYSAAIARWETLTRPAPPPTQPSKKGTPQLAAAFSEWMMGLPAGWVTDVPGITRNEALKLAGNGVVPQQAAFALRYLEAVFDRD